MIDADDLAALDERMNRVMRAGVAAALRMQAAGARSQASLMLSEARVLDATADGIENGTVELPERAVRLAVVPLDEEPEPEHEEPEPDAMQRIEAGTLGNAPTLRPLLSEREIEEGRDPDTAEFAPAMLRWLDEFDDRLRMSPHFVEAVNEAADAGLVLNEDTARIVASRVHELAEAAARRGA